jgi:sugar phosphate isomerase/epimerase
MQRRDLLRSLGASVLGVLTERPSRPSGLLRASVALTRSQEALSRRAAGPTSPPLGIQLFSLRNILATDFEGTLEQVARIGYREVEFAGLFDRPAKQVRAILDRHGLACPSSQVSLQAVTDTLSRTVADAHALGQQYVIVPWLPQKYQDRDGFRRAADLLNHAGALLRAEGLRLGYHNHAFEFVPLGLEGIGYDLRLHSTDPELVCMELDLYWIRQGGRDPFAYFRNYPGRFRLVHIKDMARNGAMVNVGHGTTRWPELLGVARRAGVRHFLTEHDNPADPIAFARESYRYLRALSW